MSAGRTDIDGSFITSTVVQPNQDLSVNTGLNPGATLIPAFVSGRGKGSMTVSVHTAEGANVNLVLALSSDVERKIVLILAVDSSPGTSTVLNQLNKFENNAGIVATLQISSTDTITKFDTDIQGKLESAAINTGSAVLNIGSIVSDPAFTNASVMPTGFVSLWNNFIDLYSNAKNNVSYGLPREDAGKVDISAPGRGHLGVSKTV